MLLKEFKGIRPVIDDSAHIADNVVLTGDIEIEVDANLWFGVVARGDMNKIRIGQNSNIQDNSVIHVDLDYVTEIGKNVTVGHLCLIHGCTIKDNVLVGMNSTIMNGAVINENTIIGAGSLVTEGKEFPEGVLVMGRPAKVIRELTEKELIDIKESAKAYVEKSKIYKADQK